MAPKKLVSRPDTKPCSALSPQSEVALRARLAACTAVASCNKKEATGADISKPVKRVVANGNPPAKRNKQKAAVPATSVQKSPVKEMAGAGNVAKKAVAAKPKATKRKHALPDKMPSGLVFKDLAKKYWEIGDIIGQGGFGYLYACKSHDVETKKNTGNFVLKVEPHENGPLFTELHFYQKLAKPEMIDEWTRRHKLAYLGIPRYYGHGPQDFNNKKYRFMVIDRCGRDLQKIFEEGAGVFSLKDVLLITSQVLHILHYIHANEYVHADVKGSNLLLGYSQTPRNQIYLVDFGLASRYVTDGVHRPFKADPKRRHDGTPEFTSRDAHEGYHPSRRGDLEILGYCMLYWLSGTLPWIHELERLDEVSRQKVMYMSDIGALLDECDLEGAGRQLMHKYLDYVAKLDYHTEPDYGMLQKMLEKGLRDLKVNVKDAFDFAKQASPQSASAQAKKRKK